MRKATILIEIEYDDSCYDSDGDPTTGERLVEGVDAALDSEVPYWAEFCNHNVTLVKDEEIES